MNEDDDKTLIADEIMQESDDGNPNNDDGLDIPDFLRRVPEAEEQPSKRKRNLVQFRTPERKIKNTFKVTRVKDPVEAAILKEAQERWRHWLPSRKEGKLRRPQLRTLVKIVRKEVKAKARLAANEGRRAARKLVRRRKGEPT